MPDWSTVYAAVACVPTLHTRFIAQLAMSGDYDAVPAYPSAGVSLQTRLHGERSQPAGSGPVNRARQHSGQ